MFQIDQSGKIEDTAKDTALALCNDSEKVIVIPKKLKRKLQEFYRLDGLTRVFIYQTFSVGIYLLIKDLKSLSSITIDKEYTGKEMLIKELVEIFLESNKKPIHNIAFKKIGENPKVHYLANDVLNKKRKANKIVSQEEVFSTLKKTDGRLRECLSILVGARPRSYKENIPYKKRPVKKKR